MYAYTSIQIYISDKGDYDIHIYDLDENHEKIATRDYWVVKNISKVIAFAIKHNCHIVPHPYKSRTALFNYVQKRKTI